MPTKRVTSVLVALVVTLLLTTTVAHAQPPSLTVSDVTLPEGDPPGTTTFTFAVTLSAPAPAGGVTFDIATADGTAQDDNPATEDNDYVARSLTAQTIPAGSSTYTFSVTVNRDTDVEPNETFFVNVTNVTGGTVADGQGTGTIQNDDVTITLIHDVQGPGASSPLSGSVTIRAIVTGLKTNGFFVQEEDAEVDANPATSEGIFVFTSSAPPAAAAVAALVQVTGTISEFVPSSDPLDPPSTQLTSPTVLQLSTGNPLPAPVTLTATFPDPAGPFDQLERVEHMRVSVASITVSGPSQGSINDVAATGTNNGRFHGVVTGVPRPFREAGIQAPDPPPSGSIPPIPRWDFNPERIRIDSAGLTGQAALTVRSGDVVGPIAGPLDYLSRAYAIQPDGTSTPVVTVGTLATTVSAAAGHEVTIASLNLQRFFDAVDDPGVDDSVLTPGAYDTRLSKASIAIRQHLRHPDIIAVQEVENLTALQNLAGTINGALGPQYDAHLVEGNDVSGLDVGFLVKRDDLSGGGPRVSVVAVAQQNDGELLVNPDSSTQSLWQRPPLLLEATVNRAGVAWPIVVIVVHPRTDVDIDSVQPGVSGWPTEGDRVRAIRQRQAESLANLVQARQSADPGEHLVVLGGFEALAANDGFVDVMNVIAGTPPPDNQTVVPGDGVDLVNPDLVNLVSTQPAERYSKVPDGNARAVDHVLVGSALVADTTARRIEYARIGADYPETDRNSSVTAFRLSDHDPVVAYLAVSSLLVADVAVSVADAPDPVTSGTSLTYTITVSNNGPDTAADVSLSNTLPVGTTFASLAAPGDWSCSTPAAGAGGTITCSNPSLSVGGGAVFTVTVAVAPSVTMGTVLSNVVVVGSSTNDSVAGNNVATATTTVAASADLTVVVVDAPDPVIVGHDIAYTVTVTNNGPSQASSVTVTDAVPANTTFVSASVLTGSGWTTSAPALGGSGTVVFSKASFVQAETAAFQIVVRVAAATAGGTVVTNTATIASAAADPVPGNNAGVATTTVDGAPTITAIADQTIVEDTATAALPFTIADVETAAAGLTLSASSSDQTLVPAASIVFGGSGGSRTVTVTPAANQSGGPVLVTITVSDGASSSSDTFTVAVTAVNDPPTIGAIADQSVTANVTVGPLPIAVDDVDNPGPSLTLSATSSNQALVTNVNVVFGGSGTSRSVTITPLPDQSGQTTITVTVSDGAASASTSFVLTVTATPRPTYFLAEGATGDFFDEDLLIANPNAADAPVTVTLHVEGGATVTETRVLPARSGTTLRVDALPGLEATSASVQISSDSGLPLAVERTQFWDATAYGGHTERAWPGPATRWFFADGAQGFFDTFVLVANPQAAPVDVTLTFLRERDTPVSTTVQVAPFSRKTIPAAFIPDLANRAFALIVEATQPIVAERAMYFGTTATRLWSGGAAAAGVTAPAATWYFAEGVTGTFFDTFILLMNPDAVDAQVTLRYLLDSGETIDVPRVVPARGRLTVNVETESDPRLHRGAMSTLVTSDRPIVAERSVYWATAEGAQPWGESHTSPGAPAAAPRWVLAEGRTGGALNFHTYVLLANPGPQPAETTVQFLPDSGMPVVKTYHVAAMSRFTIDVTAEAPELQDRSFMTLISTSGDVPIVVERSMYWNGAGLTWSGGSNAGATRLPE